MVPCKYSPSLFLLLFQCEDCEKSCVVMEDLLMNQRVHARKRTWPHVTIFVLTKNYHFGQLFFLNVSKVLPAPQTRGRRTIGLNSRELYNPAKIYKFASKKLFLLKSQENEDTSFLQEATQTENDELCFCERQC